MKQSNKPVPHEPDPMTELAANGTFGPVKRVIVAGMLSSFAAGCVIGRPARPSLPEAAQGPSATPVTGSPVVAQTTPPEDEDAPPIKSKPNAIWVRGYWHWDGVRYVWERGRWESSAAPATAP